MYAYVIVALTLVTAIGLRQREELSAIVQAGLLVALLCMKRDLIVYAVLAGVIMTCVEFVCIEYFDMWRYTNAAHTVPLWLPFMWATVAIFFRTLGGLF